VDAKGENKTGENTPKQCPKCKSTLWNTERGARERLMAEAREKKISTSLSELKSLLPPQEYIESLKKMLKTSLSEEELSVLVLSLMQAPDASAEKETERA